MTQDQIIEWACKAGFEVDTCSPPWHKRIERFAAIVAAHEREQCALVCEAGAMRCEAAAQDAIENNEPDEVINLRSTAWQITVCADAIRARGTE